jgi:hypothetical protein
MPGDELEPIKEAGEVVVALAEQSGALAVPASYGHYLARRIDQRHWPALVKGAMAAAEKINELGLPRRAFDAIDEPLLGAVLQGMAEEADPDLAEAWQNLLANTLVEGSIRVRRDFPEKLRQLDPADARILQEWGENANAETVLVDVHTTMPGDRDGPALGNLVSLGLIEASRYMPALSSGASGSYYGAGPVAGYVISELGWALLQACRPPAAPS